MDDRDLPRSERWLRAPQPPALRPLTRALALGVGAVTALRNRAFDVGLRPTSRVATPVISVGGLTVGGAGKTPAALWCARALAAEGARVAIALRGHGRRERALCCLDASPGAPLPDWRRVGDEAWMLARHLTLHPPTPGRVVVAVGADRAAAIACARRRLGHLDAVILDDGFQHRQLARDLDLVLVPPELPTLALLPAGPLREPAAALARADLRWLHAGDGRLTCPPTSLAGASIDVASRHRLRGLRGAADGLLVSPAALGGAPVTALSAVACNRNVRALLEGAGVRVAHHVALRDHAPIAPRRLEAALAAARPLIATAKDEPRLEAALARLPRAVTARARVWYAEVTLELVAGERRLRDALRRAAGG